MTAPARLAAAIVVAALTGCNHAGRSTGASTPVTPTSPALGETSVDPALTPLVNTAIDDLTRRLAINRSAISVIEARSVVWPDGSFGCPRPGMAYQQVQQDGFLIRLRAIGQDFAYHGGGSRAPFLCERAA